MMISLMVGFDSFQAVKAFIMSRLMQIPVNQVLANFSLIDSRFNLEFGMPFLAITLVAVLWLIGYWLRKTSYFRNGVYIGLRKGIKACFTK